MKRTVEADKTLLVDGPAAVTLLLGEVEILGGEVEKGTRMVIRKGKRIPLEVKKKAEFEVRLGEKASLSEVEGSTIPKSWENAVNTILEEETTEPTTVMIIGGVDSGKTSFCVYLTNKTLKKKQRVTVIDADLGQADLGPPSTISSCRMTKSIRDPFEVNAESIFFIGATSPSSAVSKVIDGIADMKARALKREVAIIIINTDGWIEGEDAIVYKVALTKQIKPNIVVGIQEQNELTFLLGALTETQTLIIESSSAVRKRDREERKLLRELGYKKYLKKVTIQSFPLSWIRISGVPFGTGMPPNRNRMNRIVEQLGATPVYCEETPNSVFIALGKEQWADEEVAKSLEGTLNKKVIIVWEGDEEGLLVALLGRDENFLGLGILQEIDYEHQVLKVYTSVKKKVSSLQVGQIKLDRTGKELGQSEVFANYI